MWQRKTKEEEEVPSMIYLIPELCRLTGLTDQMKADFKVMKDVAQFTRVTPTQRQEVSLSLLIKYNITLIPTPCRLSGSS